ncbi:unnamed protein product [Paramecium octaurelia]|uniref:Transmembrane protein n=1 Tax=Paramecium octaurelia TaxID=43137 RepID=A0A8S1XNR2_PAROT|nr:unnamed protein product [Paramecium octaurelia]
MAVHQTPFCVLVLNVQYSIVLINLVNQRILIIIIKFIQITNSQIQKTIKNAKEEIYYLAQISLIYEFFFGFYSLKYQLNGNKLMFDSEKYSAVQSRYLQFDKFYKLKVKNRRSALINVENKQQKIEYKTHILRFKLQLRVKLISTQNNWLGSLIAVRNRLWV